MNSWSQFVHMRNRKRQPQLHLSETLRRHRTNMDVAARLFTPVMLLISLVPFHARAQAHGFHISTSRSQFFEYESASFGCEGLDSLSRLRLVSSNKEVADCDPRTQICTVPVVYQTDSGRFWCETSTERSSSVNITVTAGSVVLLSPALPVTHGHNVSLRCRTRTGTGTPTDQEALFYRDDVLLQSGSEELLLLSVSSADEGVYRCSISSLGASPGSRLLVTGEGRAGGALTPSPDDVFILSCRVLVFKLILVLLLLALHFKHTASCVSGDASVSASLRLLKGTKDTNGLSELRERNKRPNVLKLSESETSD